MRRAYLTLLSLWGAALIASAAHAGSAEDGNAGLDALNRGAYGEAIRLFTRALKAGDLSKDDQEFAYLNRGKAYQAEGKKSLALADFRKAASLRPDDAEVQAALGATSGTTVRPVVAQAPPPDPDAPWGSLAKQLDTYWLEVDDGPTSYSICRWQTPHVVVACTGLGKNGKQSAVTYERDPATGTITYHQTLPTPLTATVEIHGDAYALDIEDAGKYFRETFTPIDATSGQVTIELYDGGVWKTLKTEKSVQTTPEAVQALNWRLGKDKTHSFWKDLGQSLAAGAAAGIVQGLQGQPQQ